MRVHIFLFQSDFVLVCICGKYKEQVDPKSSYFFLNKERPLHTAQIFQMMQTEVRENNGNDRIIPVLMKGK